MKFLAILKDSFREAVDGWVIYLMLILSTLFIVLIACIGYKPVDADKAFQSIVGQFRIVYADHNRSAIHGYPLFGSSFDLKEIVQLTEASQPQESDYRLRLVVTDSGRFPRGINGPDDAPPAEPGKPKKSGYDPEQSSLRQAVAFWNGPGDFEGRRPDPKSVTDDQVLAFIKDLFEFYGNISVRSVERVSTDAPEKLEFLVTTNGQKGVRGWLHEPTMFTFDIPMEMSLGMMIWIIQDRLINGFGAWVALLVGVVLTSFFIPNMMRKGSIDLMLSKPLHRASLLLYKYIGGLTFVFLNTTYAVVGVWLVMGLRSGVWSTGFLLTIFGITFYFAILYAVSTFLGVLTRNAIVAILGTVAFWFLMWIVGQIYGFVDLFRHEAATKDRVPKWVYVTADTANAILPRTSDLNKLNSKLVVQDTLVEGDKRRAKLDNLTWPSWGEVLGVSMAYIVILLGLSVWRFSTRDY